jgi:hypothetical protein
MVEEGKELIEDLGRVWGWVREEIGHGKGRVVHKRGLVEKGDPTDTSIRVSLGISKRVGGRGKMTDWRGAWMARTAVWGRLSFLPRSKKGRQVSPILYR